MNVSNSAVSLTVIQSEFHACKASPHRGGGIYAEGIGEVKIERTFFADCTCEPDNNAGGGGMQLFNVQEPQHIIDSSFISCESGNDGGGISIWYTPVYQETCVKGCRFIGCKGNNSTSSDGGSIIIWYSGAAIGCSETLFSHCSSEYRGGAATCFSYTSTEFSSSLPLFSFCFFTDNTCNVGSDVFLVEWIPSEPFFFSFSTTGESNVHYVDNADDRTKEDCWKPKSNWLPQGIVTRSRGSIATTPTVLYVL